MGAEADTTAAVIARWRRAGSALAQVRRDELRRMTDGEALAAAEELLDLVWLLPPSTRESGWSSSNGCSPAHVREPVVRRGGGVQDLCRERGGS